MGWDYEYGIDTTTELLIEELLKFNLSKRATAKQCLNGKVNDPKKMVTSVTSPR